jgi:hypothetical protein
MTDEAATVHWLPARVYRPVGGHEPEAVWGRDRTFETVDNAVTFVMEELGEAERTNAYIATALREVCIDDIQRMYTARKKQIWNVSSNGFSFVISHESRSGPGFHGRPGFVASWRPMHQNRSAVTVTGSPFETFAEAEEACKAVLEHLLRP